MAQTRPTSFLRSPLFKVLLAEGVGLWLARRAAARGRLGHLRKRDRLLESAVRRIQRQLGGHARRRW